MAAPGAALKQPWTDVLDAGQAAQVSIILSTFNGQRYLEEQLDSFCAQKGVRWRLIWRDDGSTDATTTVMNAFVRRLPPGQVACSAHSGANLGIFDSFLTLLSEALDSPAIAFADQDDVWLPEKLQRAMQFLNTIEPGRPAVYCARQILVDDALEPIGLSPRPRRAPGFPGALLQNTATGCTVVLNQAAARAIHGSVKPKHSAHDWWACLFVSAIGGIVWFDDRPAILYRQHHGNVEGASKSRLRRFVGALSRGASAHNAQFKEHVDALLRNERHLTPEAAACAHRIRAAWPQGWLSRLGLFRTKGFRRQTWMETALLALWLLRGDQRFGDTLRSSLRNGATIWLYEKARHLAQTLTILRDRQSLWYRRVPVPEVRCLKRPPHAGNINCLALVVIFSDRLDSNHHRAIRGLNRAGYTVALLNNRSFTAGQGFPNEVAFALETGNAGRDIGAYIRGLHFIRSLNALAANARILFLNDSVVYLPGHEAVFADLATRTSDWVGITANRQSEFHVSSWCFGLSAGVVDSEAFRRWSTALLPINNRAYLIREGEVGLSQALLAAGYRPDVLFGSDSWRTLVRELDETGQTSQLILPRRLRGHADEQMFLNSNQTNLLTVPGVATGRFPFLKKDLLYRDVFDRSDIDDLCTLIAARYGTAIADESHGFLFARGNGSDLRGVRKMRWCLDLD